MEKTLMMPASYNVMNEQEMTYTQGGASAFEALVAWIIPVRLVQGPDRCA